MTTAPRTASSFNNEFTGVIEVGSSSDTVASGYMWGLAMDRERQLKEKISKVLSRFVQDPIIVQQATHEIYKELGL